MVLDRDAQPKRTLKPKTVFCDWYFGAIMSFCYDEDMTELLYMKDFDVEAC